MRVASGDSAPSAWCRNLPSLLVTGSLRERGRRGGSGVGSLDRLRARRGLGEGSLDIATADAIIPDAGSAAAVPRLCFGLFLTESAPAGLTGVRSFLEFGGGAAERSTRARTVWLAFRGVATTAVGVGDGVGVTDLASVTGVVLGVTRPSLHRAARLRRHSFVGL